MLIFLKQNLCLLAAPKTGSTAIEAGFAPRADIVFRGDPRNKHMTMRKFQRFVAPYLVSLGHDRFETMALMREPIDWLSSWYRYRARDQIRGKPNSTAELSFDDFARAYISDDPPPFARVGRQATFLSDKTGRLAITHLFRYENFDNAIAFLADKTGFAPEIRTLNTSPEMDITCTAKTRQALQDYLAPEYGIYNAL